MVARLRLALYHFPVKFSTSDSDSRVWKTKISMSQKIRESAWNQNFSAYKPSHGRDLSENAPFVVAGLTGSASIGQETLACCFIYIDFAKKFSRISYSYFAGNLFVGKDFWNTVSSQLSEIHFTEYHFTDDHFTEFLFIEFQICSFFTESQFIENWASFCRKF